VPLQSGEQTVLFDAAGFTSMAVDGQNVLYLGGSFGIASLAPGANTPTPLQSGAHPVSTLAVTPEGTLYFVNIDNDVEALAPGAATAQRLPFDKLQKRSQIAAGHDGSVYLADNESGTLLKLPAGADRPVELPVNDIGSVGHIVVDAEGNLYASVRGQIVKIVKGADTAETVPGATQNVAGLAVDTAGNLYATDVEANTVSRMPAGGGDWVELPFHDLQSPTRIAVDGDGNVFVMAAQKNLGIHVIRLAVG
jgi:streptogramin lyase